MDKELLKKFLNHSIAKSDGQINISILDLSNIENNDNRYNKLIRVFKTVDSLLLNDGHKKIIEKDYYNVYANCKDDSELFVLQNKDYCITLIELI
jgi:hypothetical protein|nr:MAG: hypothetical protein [Bacteriophage sp.]DAU91068.1 MAG TPA: hypothetical protein [Caudoviricetes sp.]